MVAPLQGLQAIPVISDPQPEATPEERYGGTADPRHGVPGEAAEPYPWNLNQGVQFGHVGPLGVENELLGFDDMEHVDPAGQLQQDPTSDLTPATAAGGRKTHAAPWPKGVPLADSPDENAARRQESLGIHSSDTGGDRNAMAVPTMAAQQDNWIEYESVTPGTTLQQPVARVTRAQAGIAPGGFAGRANDRVQSLAKQNDYGFDSAHLYRRVAQSPIPGNFDMLRPGSRPMLKRVAGYPGPRGTGGQSPFAGDTYTQPFDTNGAILQNLPGEYLAPPEPALAAPIYSADESPGVELF